LPRVSNLPRGVLSTGGVLIQSLGILWIAYGIIFGDHLSNLNFFINVLIVPIFSICDLLFCWILSKRYSYSATKETIEK